MYTQIRCFTLLTLLVGFSFFKVEAQKNSDWQPIFLLVTGANVMDGVEASFKLGTCNNEDVVFVKFINHNDYAVKLEWSDAIFNQELKWLYRTEINKRESITLAPKMEAQGEAINKKHPELIIKLKDFIVDKKNFKRYLTSQLIVTPVQ
jgi:hypothetical protein